MTNNKIYIGAISGTSMDGVDVAILDFNPSPKLLTAKTYPYDESLKTQLVKILNDKYVTLNDVATLDNKIGLAFADAINQAIATIDIDKKNIVAIGSHGQNIYHAPKNEYPITWQIGNPNLITTKTQITTICDFRRKDLALGGQGAPLAPLFHQEFLSADEVSRVVINIGGISNITILANKKSDSLIGFDTGPGNTLIDNYCKKLFNLDYDKSGNIAKSGKVDNKFLKELLDDEYFNLDWPKSTGLEKFNIKYVENCLEAITVSKEDLIATLSEFTAVTITDAIKQSAKDCDEVFVCGGGVHNSYLLQRIAEILDIPVYSTEKLGFDPNFMEAMLFAYLAKNTIEKKPCNLSSVTGAKKSAILGAIYYPD